VKEAARRYGDRIAVGVDCRDGFVHTKGWRVNSGLSGLAFARDMAELGVRTLVVTDIARDGMERGPSFELLYAMAETGCRIIASGGVTDLSDIRRLRDHGLYGAIAGKAVYSGKLPLGEAIRLAGETEGKKGD